MNATTRPDVSLADYYYGFLKHLSHKTKLELIIKLAASVKDNEPIEDDADKDSIGSLLDNCEPGFDLVTVMSEIKAYKEARKKDIDAASEIF